MNDDVRFNVDGDHPRIRGEHSRPLLPPPLGSGSSPHTRGARYREIGFETIDRIIPAYAGSTWHTPNRPVMTEDHPRIRGEHRGRPRVYPISSRIIPAYAGSTLAVLVQVADRRDHPRIRGEHMPVDGST